MKPSNFPQSTGVLERPPSMTEEECAPLHVYRASDYFISCWHPTWRERLALVLGRPAWLWILGSGHPPVAIEVHNPFRGDALTRAPRSDIKSTW